MCCLGTVDGVCRVKHAGQLHHHVIIKFLHFFRCLSCCCFIMVDILFFNVDASVSCSVRRSFMSVRMFSYDAFDFLCSSS
jgi:hypothetical protein